MKKIKITLYEGCEYHAELTIQDGKGSLIYFHKGKEMDDLFMASNYNRDISRITIRLAEFICHENQSILYSY
ncbi:trehalose utilization protein [Chryseobacterium rhizosphaerae]|uniref:hypothetical protein n=1 Tax=Chryseobacterium rhizosphaerae TaxID=395937 RepID=UPI0028560B08|nr:hypothetical protein [Chryseobacterium rhizosphaerae]MDR6548475.1 trehalose utilization protein [Chryseobacterium rhizosphaerae]